MIRIIGVVLISFALGGCATVLKDLQTCERHYNGNISGGTINPAIFAGNAKIDCCPVGQAANADHTNCISIPGAIVASGG